jgi:hypothetical protein
MLRRMLVSVLLALSLLTPTVWSDQALGAVHPAAQKKDCLVYVTRTGHRYHQGWCRYLRQSKIPMSRSRAIESGFTPCRVCGGSDCESR